ncbi:hypothetical protein RISK_000441 [Rhodopirellula islandica]|uniref:Uncharacterized protein n=1 Tax=Rhodopirellula islandica TaxID=595434 RepID=A0A0J1BLL7_RHOIS|nr:hypothetical protein [Rhodopirellula islandica]KLU07363.1 hypothetical protein RISK_000441 [Rhodopirellula islandica]
MNWLTHQWILAGMVSSAARFVPIPFVDDVIRGQCRRFVVTRTLEAHNRTDSLKELRAFYAEDSGCVAGCLGMLAKAPLKLLLFPVRKIVAILTSVRGVPMEIIRMVLLGRTLDRLLKEEVIAAGPVRPQQVVAMREAFEEAFARMDFRVVRAGMSDALAGATGWKESAMDLAAKVAGRENEAQPAGDLRADENMEAGAKQLEEVLERPELVAAFIEFDDRFDDAFAMKSTNV